MPARDWAETDVVNSKARVAVKAANLETVYVTPLNIEKLCAKNPIL